MSSLQAQLDSHAQVVNLKPNTRPSFIFGARQAADLDLETVYGMGVNGYQELVKLDSRFAAFDRNLFGAVGKQQKDRALNTLEENRLIDASISSFLRLLSPFFLLRPSHKVLEFLIRRYKIHEYNVDDVMFCILPFHETKHFARMVQLLALGPRSVWKSLRKCQETGSPLDRESLLNLCKSDPAVFGAICQMPQRAIESRTLSHVIASFYGVTVIGYVSSLPIVEDIVLTRLIPRIIDGVSATHSPLYQTTSYLILSHLSTRCTLEHRTLQAVLGTLCKNATEVLLREALLCVAVVCQTQHLIELPDEAFKFLVKSRDLVDTMKDIMRGHNIGTFVDLFSAKLVHFSSKHSNYMEVLKECVDSLNLEGQVSRLTCEMVKYCVTFSDQNEEQDSLGEIQMLLRRLAVSYSNDVDSGVGLAYEDVEKLSGSNEAARSLQSVLSVTFGGTIHDYFRGDLVQATTLSLALNHNNASVRRQAFRQLNENMSINESDEHGAVVSTISQPVDTNSNSMVSSFVLAGLTDSDPSVIAQILQSTPLVQSISIAAQVKVLDAILSRTFTDGKTKSVNIIAAALSRLVGLLKNDGDQLTDEEKYTVIRHIVGFMLPRSQSRKITKLAARLAGELGSIFAIFKDIIPLLATISRAIESSEVKWKNCDLDLMGALVSAVGSSIGEYTPKHREDKALEICMKILEPSHNLPSLAKWDVWVIMLSALYKSLSMIKDIDRKMQIAWFLITLGLRLFRIRKNLVSSGAAQSEGSKINHESVLKVVDWSSLPELSHLSCWLDVNESKSDEIFGLLGRLSVLCIDHGCKVLSSGKIRSNFNMDSLDFSTDIANLDTWSSVQESIESNSNLSCKMIRVFVSIFSIQSSRDFALLTPVLTTLVSNLQTHIIPLFSSIWRCDSAMPQRAITRSLNVFQFWFRGVILFAQKHKGSQSPSISSETNVLENSIQSMIPSLIVALQHFDVSVRQACIDVFSALQEILTTKGSLAARSKPISWDLSFLHLDQQCSLESIYSIRSRNRKNSDTEPVAVLTPSAVYELLNELLESKTELLQYPKYVSRWLSGLQSVTETREKTAVKELRCNIISYILDHMNSLSLSRRADHARLQLLSALSETSYSKKTIMKVSEVLKKLVQSADVDQSAEYSPQNPTQQQNLVYTIASVITSRIAVHEMGWSHSLLSSSTAKTADLVFDNLVAAIDCPALSVCGPAVRALTTNFLTELHHSFKGQLFESLIGIVSKPDIENPAKVYAAPALDNFPLHLSFIIPYISRFKENTENTDCLVSTLEILQRSSSAYLVDSDHCNEEIIVEYSELLFDIAVLMFGMIEEKHDGFDVSYIVQLLLLCLNTTVSTADIGIDKIVHSNIGFVLQCAANDFDVQIQHHALDLISSITSTSDSIKIETLVETFKLVGSSFVDKDDSASFNVVLKVINAVVPQLARERGADFAVHLFVEWLPKIPDEHRLSLLFELVSACSQKTAQADALGFVVSELLFLLDGGEDMETEEEENAVLPNEYIQNTVLALFRGFAASLQLNACERVFDIVKQECSSTDSVCSPAWLLSVLAVLNDAFDIDGSLFSDSVIDTKSSVSSVERSVWRAIESVLSLQSIIGKWVDEFSDLSKTEVIQSVTKALHRLIEKFNKLLSLRGFGLTISQLMQHENTSVRQLAMELLSNRLNSSNTDKNGFDWSSSMKKINRNVADTFCSLPENLLAEIITSLTSLDNCGGGENAIHIQASFSALESLVIVLKTHYAALLTKTVPTAITVIENAMMKKKVKTKSGNVSHRFVWQKVDDSSRSAVISSSLVYLGVLATELGTLLLEHIQRIYSVILTAFSFGLGQHENSQSIVDRLITLSSLAALNGLFLKLSGFASPYIPTLLSGTGLLHPELASTPTIDVGSTGVVGIELIMGASELVTMAHTARLTLAEHIAPRVLIPHLTSVLNSLHVSDQPTMVSEAVSNLLTIMSLMISRFDRPAVERYHRDTFRLILSSFDDRLHRLNSNGWTNHQIWSKTSMVESTAIQTAIQLAAKLSGTMFRSWYVEAIDWGTQSRSHIVESKTMLEKVDPSRFLSLLRLSTGLVGRLKSIVVPYCGPLLEILIGFLNGIPDVISACDGVYPADKPTTTKNVKRSRDEENEILDFKHYLPLDLLSSLVELLHKLFTHDLDGFIGSERQEELVGPMVEMLESPKRFTVKSTMKRAKHEEIQYVAHSLYNSRVVTPLISCLSQFAVLVASDVLWRPLNHRVLLLSRSGRADVRLNSVRTVRELYRRMGEDWLTLLPESVSFFAELIEDENEQVEKEMRALVVEIEKLLGEPLNLR